MTHAEPDQQRAFAKAVSMRDARKAIRLAREDPSVHQLKLPSCHGYERALHAAMRLKSVRLAEVLLDQGKDVDIVGGGGYSPLFLARVPGSNARGRGGRKEEGLQVKS